MDAIELKVHRANTAAFIDQRRSIIALNRPNKDRARSGGTKVTVDSLVTPQTFRIIELSSATSQFVQTTDGQQRVVQYQLLGLWDADMVIGDWWHDAERDWLIADIARSNEYEFRALVVERGK